MGFLGRLRQFISSMRLVELRDEKAVSVGTATQSPSSLLPSPPPDDTVTAPQVGRTIRRFVPPELLSRLPSLSRRELDLLDFGCVRVSDQGIVESYNLWESEFAGVPQDRALGQNFFRQLAPCTNNRLIFGRFKDGVAEGELDVIVSYAFTYKMKPTLVDVHLYRDLPTGTNWILVRKTEGVK